LPELRARPCWLSPEENKENIQNEITIFADENKKIQTLGRSSKKDIQLKLKAVSAEHCQIGYSADSGWTLSEISKFKISSNGTYVYMKSFS
jgi:pSer/pThr/pTyr-binding forkhead associated (FHA) protein